MYIIPKSPFTPATSPIDPVFAQSSSREHLLDRAISAVERGRLRDLLGELRRQSRQHTRALQNLDGVNTNYPQVIDCSLTKDPIDILIEHDQALLAMYEACSHQVPKRLETLILKQKTELAEGLRQLKPYASVIN